MDLTLQEDETQIVAMAGVTRGALYHHFADKQALFTEIVTHTVDEAAEPVHAEVASPATAGTPTPTSRPMTPAPSGSWMHCVSISG